MPQKIVLAIFDMDGLMFDTEQVYCDALIDATKAKGLDYDEDFLYSVIGTSDFDPHKFLRGDAPEGFDPQRYMEQAVEDSIDAMCQGGVPKKDGLDELLDFFDGQGISMVVATSTGLPRANRLLQSAGVLDRFQKIISGQTLARGKPFPDIFLKACEDMGVPPEKALVLEDSVNGARAARAADIRCIVVPDLVRPTEDVQRSALAVVNSLRDVPPLLQSLGLC